MEHHTETNLQKNHQPSLNPDPGKIAFDPQRFIDPQARRDVLSVHPVFKSSTVLPTLPIKKMVSVAKRAIFLQQRGICFGAESGAGKTTSLLGMKQAMEYEFPGLAVYHHDTQNQQVPSIRAFFQHFLDSVGHPELRGETYMLRTRLRNVLVDSGRRSGMNVVMLLIDEAQAMNEVDFKFLKDISNALNKGDVALVTILAGQEPQFSRVREKLISDGHLDLVGRFLMRKIPFAGYTTKEDVESILANMDKQEYPPGSGWTWTQFFFPKAWQTGFRLKDQIDALFEALANLPQAEQGNVRFPARQVYQAVHGLLIDYAGHDAPNMVLPAGAWKKVVTDAQVENALNFANIGIRNKRNRRKGA